jgi:hypothetical protein
VPTEQRLGLKGVRSLLTNPLVDTSPPHDGARSGILAVKTGDELRVECQVTMPGRRTCYAALYAQEMCVLFVSAIGVAMRSATYVNKAHERQRALALGLRTQQARTTRDIDLRAMGSPDAFADAHVPELSNGAVPSSCICQLQGHVRSAADAP